MKIERNRGNRWRFFREIRCNVEEANPNNRRVAGLLIVSKNYIFRSEGIIIVAVDADCECNLARLKGMDLSLLFLHRQWLAGRPLA